MVLWAADLSAPRKRDQGSRGVGLTAEYYQSCVPHRLLRACAHRADHKAGQRPACSLCVGCSYDAHLFWLAGAGVGWLLAAVLIGAVVPFTFVVIMPTNRRMLSPSLDVGSDEARALLVRWGQL